MENTETKLIKGIIEGVNGPVVDVKFAKGGLPKLRDELYVEVQGESLGFTGLQGQNV